MSIKRQTIGISSLVGGVSGAIMGGIGEAVKYFSTTTKLYRSVSDAEYLDIKNTGKFNMGRNSMEGNFLQPVKPTLSSGVLTGVQAKLPALECLNRHLVIKV